MRKSDDYAGNQIRLLLNDLKTAAHNAKVKAVERFQQYITQYEPDIADDTVDYLFSGVNEMTSGEGLLYYCGVNSGKHGGQLKRICAPCISLLRWIVTMETDDELGNIYYERFVHQPVSELAKINFEKHITQQTEGGGGLPFGGGGKSRSGNCEDAFELLLILVNDHRNEDGYDEPVDAFDMLNGNKVAYDMFKKWAAKSGNDIVKQAVKIAKASRPLEVDTRPTRWDDVVFKCVPLQEGEEGAVEMIVNENVVPPIPDPLGVSDVDLRVTQELYSSGRLFKTRGGYARRGTAWSAPNASGGGSSGGRKSGEFEPAGGAAANGNSSSNNSNGGGADEDSEDEDSEEESVPLNITTGTPYHLQKPTKQMLSVIPSDKSFSTTLFLTLVHGSTSFLQLQKGMDNLNELLQQQSSRRVNLVRLHFGLFVQCADGLEWLKAFRNGVTMPKRGKNRAPSIIDSIESSNEAANRMNNKAGGGGAGGVKDKGMEKLKKAQVTLDHAKIEAQSTLAPILERMRNSRRVKSAEKVLRRMAGVLEHPYKMRQALDRGDLQEVVQIYQRVQAIPTTISLRILQRVKNVAESIMLEMKKQLTTALLTPSTDHRMLLRYCKILLDLDGTQAYLDILRQCIVRQILHFVELIRETREKFASDAVDAHNKGLELNMMNKSSFYSNADRESITNTLRKYSIPSGRSAKRSPSVRRSATGGSFYVDQSNNADDDLASRHYSNDEFDDGDEDNASEIDWLDYEDSINGDAEEAEWSAAAGGGGEGGSGRSGSISGTNKKDVDACLVLSGQLCKHYLEYVVDTMAKWFPCLMRLVSEFVIVQAAFNRKNNAGGVGFANANSAASTAAAGATAASNAPAPFLSSAMKGASKVLNRMPSTNVFGQTRPTPPPVTKLLGSALKLYTDFLRHVIHGIGAPFQSFLVSADLVAAFGELDLKAITNNPNAAMLYATTSNTYNYLDPSVFDVLLSSQAFTSTLRDPYHRTVLREIYDLYDGMESILTSDVAVNAHHARVHGEKNTRGGDRDGSGSGAVGGVTVTGVTSNVPFGGGKQLQFSSTAGAAGGGGGVSSNQTFVGGNSSELYFLQSSSPYCEAMTALLLFSKEGEMDVAHKIMERLHTLTYKVCEYSSPRQEPTVTSPRSISGKSYRSEKGTTAGAGTTAATAGSGGGGVSGGGAGSAAASAGAAGGMGSGGGVKDRNMLRLEQSVHDLESLVLKCLHKINSVIKRTDWVAQVVHDDIVKVMITFIDALRREGILIEDSKSGLMKNNMIDLSIGGGSNSPSMKRNRKKSSSNAARASVSNGLIIQTLEEELKNSELIDKQKVELLLDMLRACIRLRNFSLPMFRKQLLKLFPLPQGGGLFDSPFGGNSPVSAGMASLASTAAAAGGGGGLGSQGISGEMVSHKPSLMNKLFAFEAVPETGTKKIKNKSIHPSAENIASILASSAAAKDPKHLRSSDEDSEQAGDAAGVVVVSLAERLRASLCEDMGNLRPILSDVVELEDKTVSRYLDQKKKEILNTIYAGYSLLCHRELAGKWKGPSGGGGSGGSIPSHLSRILLLVGHEKSSLYKELGKLTVEYGGRKTHASATVNSSTATAGAKKTSAGGKVHSLLAKYRAKSASVDETPEHDSDLDYDDTLDEHDDIVSDIKKSWDASDDYTLGGGPSIVPTAVSAAAGAAAKKEPTAGLRYCDHIYYDLCCTLLDIYSDLISKLKSNNFLQSTQGFEGSGGSSSSHGSSMVGIPSNRTSGSVGNCATINALSQAQEEHLYLQNILRSVLSSINANFAATHQTHNFKYANVSSKPLFLTADKLMEDSKLFTMLIAN